MHAHELRAYANSMMVFLFYLTFHIFTNDFGLLKNISKASADAATILIAITLLLGPLSRFFSKHFRHDLIYRKPIGIAGVFFAVLHVIVAFVNTYNADLVYMYNPASPNFFAVIFCTLSILVLAISAVTSTKGAVKKLGFKKWKTLQRTAYIAILFGAIHFSLVGNGYFLRTTTGKALLGLVIIALAAKIVVILLNKKKTHSKLEKDYLTKK